MKFHLGVTDLGWYRFLAERENEDINFWHPGNASDHLSPEYIEWHNNIHLQWITKPSHP